MEALTFGAAVNLGVQMASLKPGRACLRMGNATAGGSLAAWERKSPGLGAGEGLHGPRGEQRAGEKGPLVAQRSPRCGPSPDNGVPPLRGDPRWAAPGGAAPRSSCLFRTRPCKYVHLILNPLRRSPLGGGKGVVDNPLQIEGLGTPVLGRKCLHHACK